MAATRTIAALLLVVVMVAVAAAGDLPSRWQFRRWVRQCRKDSFIAKAKPLYSMKKTISGLYNPSTRHAFRKSQVTFSKLEFATIRKPSEAEKCLMECLAEKQGMINGTQLNSEKIMKVMTAFGNHFNKVSPIKKINMTLLKRNTGKCIVGTHGTAKSCELGYQLFHCLTSAVKESIYKNETQSPTTTNYPSSTESMTGETDSATSMPSTTTSTASSQPDRFVRRPYTGYRMAHHMGYRRFPPPPQTEMGPPPPPMPLNAMPPPPPPMALNAMPPPPPHGMPMHAMAYRVGPPPPAMVPAPMVYEGIPPPPPGMGPQPIMYHAMHPAYVAYRQGSGVVQVYGESPAPWRPHWRAMHGGPRMAAPLI